MRSYNLLYVTFVDINKADHIGIKKKIISQVKSFDSCYYVYGSNSIACLCDKESIITRKYTPTRESYLDTVKKWIETYEIDSVYIRYSQSNTYFIDFLKYLKQYHLRTVLEIPSYPYDEECDEGRWICEDRVYREKICNYIEKISTYSDDERIYGIKCFKLMNGVDVSNDYCEVKKSKENALTMIAVSSMAKWHGYERIIRGIYEYYQSDGNWEIKLLMVGEGTEEMYYKTIVSELGVENNVVFLGKIEGDQIRTIYKEADIAIGSLGFYKIKADGGSPIKGAEYCANGMPLVLGYKDYRFKNNEWFVKYVPNNDMTINIQEIIEFYQAVCKIPNYRRVIHKYAINHLSWKSIMRPIIDYYQEE